MSCFIHTQVLGTSLGNQTLQLQCLLPYIPLRQLEELDVETVLGDINLYRNLPWSHQQVTSAPPLPPPQPAPSGCNHTRHAHLWLRLPGCLRAVAVEKTRVASFDPGSPLCPNHWICIRGGIQNSHTSYTSTAIKQIGLCVVQWSGGRTSISNSCFKEIFVTAKGVLDCFCYLFNPPPPFTIL